MVEEIWFSKTHVCLIQRKLGLKKDNIEIHRSLILGNLNYPANSLNLTAKSDYFG